MRRAQGRVGGDLVKHLYLNTAVLRCSAGVWFWPNVACRQGVRALGTYVQGTCVQGTCVQQHSGSELCLGGHAMNGRPSLEALLIAEVQSRTLHKPAGIGAGRIMV